MWIYPRRAEPGVSSEALPAVSRREGLASHVVERMPVVFVPDNDLERLLVKATQDPSQQLQFYRMLLASNVHVIQHGPAMGKKGKVKRKKGRQVNLRYIEMGGETFLPFFSSMARLQTVIEDQAKCLTLNASDFLKMTRGAQLLLNPGSPVGKAFTPAEVAALLDGSIFGPEAEGA